MRRMSFAMTERQLVAGHKTVTRRLGWVCLKPGDELLAVDKAMGLKKGQKARPLARIRVKSTERVALAALDGDEPRKEGFPWMSCAEFVGFFCRSLKCTPDTVVNRIEFEVLEVLAPLENMDQMAGRHSGKLGQL